MKYKYIKSNSSRTYVWVDGKPLPLSTSMCDTILGGYLYNTNADWISFNVVNKYYFIEPFCETYKHLIELGYLNREEKTVSLKITNFKNYVITANPIRPSLKFIWGIQSGQYCVKLHNQYPNRCWWLK